MKMKRTLSMAMALCLMFGSAASLPDGVFETSTSISISASANGGPAPFVSGDYKYQLLEDGTASITGYKGTATKLTIPSKLDDKKVTAIGSLGSMIDDCTKLKSITIPSSVTSIGIYAFMNCPNIENITIPSSVTSIGGGAFSGTKWLENQQKKDPQVVVNGILIDAFKCKGKVTVSSDVKTIGNWAFMDNENITSVTIPKSVTSIGENAFFDCTKLTSITIPSSVTSIGSGAFFNCTNLENITIPNSVTSIGGSAFSETKWLEKQREKAPLVIVNGIVIDGKNCKGKVTIPSSVTSIGDWAFSGCSGIKSITIPDSVTSIGGDAFSDCSGIKSITIPDSVTSIGEVAFSNTSITSVTIPGSVSSIGESAFYGCQELKNVTIKEGVTQISDFMFYECENLESITIPNSVTSIGRDAFELCHSLKSITIPGSVINVGEFAFNACDLSSITIEEGVTSIGNSAFCNCNATSVTIPKSVTSIGDHAFGYYFTEDSDRIDGFKIYCYKNSAGEKYAKDNEFDFELLVLEHVEAKAATCGEDGNIEYWTYDGKFYSDEKATTEITEEETIVKATGEHTFGEWEQTVAPTCTAKGSETRKCSVCGQEETREVEALGHKFEDKWTVTKEATCTQAGSEERVCTVCGGKEEGGKETREIKAKGHKFDKEWTVVRTASAGKPSLRVRYCVNCKGEEEGGMQEKEGSATLEKERIYGDNRFKTSLAIADQLKNANNGKAFENIIIASGADFADALSASYLAKVKNAPILLTANAKSIIKETVSYISKNAAKGAKVYIVGGTSVVPSSMITDLKALGFKAKRLAGKNRYDTNIEVLKEAGVTNEKILIASGMDYADALSASAVGLPILLVAGKGKSLTPNQKAYLKSLKNVKVEKGAAPLSKAYVIGGAGAVSADIFKQTKDYFKGVSRVYGSNRYVTSVKVAETFFKNKTPATVAVAYGLNYPDGLCGGPLALAYKCPLILTINQRSGAAVAYAKSIKAKSVVAFGGKQLISLDTMNKILGK